MLAVLACYGTMTVVALLPVIGLSVDVDDGLLTAIITGLVVVAVLGMAYSFRLHRRPGPLALTVAAAGLLGWVFLGRYSPALELIGFIGLVIASIWDFRVKRRAGAVKCESSERP